MRWVGVWVRKMLHGDIENGGVDDVVHDVDDVVDDDVDDDVDS